MNKIIISLIKIYQKTNHRPRCKFMPTCSNYAITAYRRFSFFYASLLTIFRIIRCNPFSRGGYDPVPLSIEEKNIILLSNPFNSKE